MSDELLTRQGTVRLCADVDYAIDNQLFFPFVDDFNGAKDDYKNIKGVIRKQDYQKIDNNRLEFKNGFGIFSPFLVLPSTVCDCQIDNVEVVNKSVTFNCDRLLLCVEYIVCLKLFDIEHQPQCQEIKASFTKEIDRYDFAYLPPFGSGSGIALSDFLSAEGTCVHVTPVFDAEDCFVVSYDDFSAVFLTFPFEVLVKLFRTQNVTLPLITLGPPVEKITKTIDRCNTCFTSVAQKIKE
ncbi:hypothetical protein V6C27_05010 [Peptococcaceae bacterium 1198_IL3148]